MQTQHGGRRVGSGRPRKYELASVRISLELPARAVELIDSKAALMEASRNDVVAEALGSRWGAFRRLFRKR
jgi:hypothetical protein